MFSLAMLLGILAHPILGIMGLYKLIKQKLSIWKWIITILFLLTVPLVFHLFYYRLHAGEEVSNMYFGFKTIYAMLIPYVIVGLFSTPLNKFISNLSFACLLPSIIYAFTFSQKIMEHFNVIVRY